MKEGRDNIAKEPPFRQWIFLEDGNRKKVYGLLKKTLDFPCWSIY
jgi:hypothetical protein